MKADAADLAVDGSTKNSKLNQQNSKYKRDNWYFLLYALWIANNYWFSYPSQWLSMDLKIFKLSKELQGSSYLGK